MIVFSFLQDNSLKKQAIIGKIQDNSLLLLAYSGTTFLFKNIGSLFLLPYTHS